MSEPTYKTEFPDYVLDFEPPKQMKDASWSQDACPRWEAEEPALTMWADDPDPAKREIDLGGRFHLSHIVGGVERLFEGESWQPIICTDDISEVAAVVDRIFEEIATIKAELPEMLAAKGVDPSSVTSFSDLHDHMDANMLVETDDEDELGVGKNAPDHDEAYCGFHNAIHHAIDMWIKEGGLTQPSPKL